MNSVSWFIYIAQITGSLGTMFMVFGVIGGIAIAVYCFVATMAKSIEKEEFLPQAPAARYFALVFVLILIGNLMPAKNTMYAIAASQVGEKIAATESIQGITDDATKALRQWIKNQIEPEKKG